MHTSEKYTYRVTWSEEDQEHVGLCAEFPSLSWLAASTGEALNGITKPNFFFARRIRMSSRKLIVAVVVLVAFVGAWYAFRPERLFINQKVNEEFPTASAANTAPMKLAAGEFHAGAHETKGTATVFQLADGKKTLRLTNFATSNGPDVHVYLSRDTGGKWSEATSLYVGPLKATNGSFNYMVQGADADLSQYKSVVVWCRQFSVLITWADLH